MISDYTLQAIKDNIYSNPEYWGCIVIYIGKPSSKIVAGGIQVTNNAKKIVLIEELEMGTDQPPRPQIKNNQQFQGDELKGGVINCSFFAIAAITTLSGAATEPLTLGLSSVVVVAGYAGMLSSGAQCLNSIVRTVDAYADPSATTLSSWDAKAWYTDIMTVVDIVGIATGVVGIAGAANEIKTFLRLRNLLVSEEQLNNLNRAERIAAFQKAIKEASKDEKTAKEFNNLVERLGVKATRQMANTVPTITQGNFVRLGNSLSKAGQEKIANSIRDIIINSTNLGLNGAPSSFSGSASGQLNKFGNYVVHIIDSN